MDKRNSKESMLKQIDYLEQKLKKVYAAGCDGIGYVGIANYAERESEALQKLAKAYYEE